MNILITKHDTSVELYVTGRIDAVTSPELENTIRANVNSISTLILNLKEVDYISSAGLRVLLTSRKLLSAQRGTFKIINVTPSVMEILSMTGFADILTIE